MRRDYYDTGIVNLQTRDRVTMAKMYQVDKMAIMATMAKMAFQLGTLLNHEYKVNQIESIKMGMSRKIVLKSAAHLTRFKLIANGQQMAGKRKPPASSLQGVGNREPVISN